MSAASRYLVVAVGPECPFALHEILTLGHSWTSDIFDGTILEQEFIRSDGTRAMLVRSPLKGATLRPLEPIP